jgi:hypothetical protein
LPTLPPAVKPNDQPPCPNDTAAPAFQPLLLLLLRSLLLCSADWSVMSLSAIRPVPALPATSEPVMWILDCSAAPVAINVVLPPA